MAEITQPCPLVATTDLLARRTDELIERFASLSPAEQAADIERTNRYLASEEGQREFADLRRPPHRVEA